MNAVLSGRLGDTANNSEMSLFPSHIGGGKSVDVIAGAGARIRLAPTLAGIRSRKLAGLESGEHGVRDSPGTPGF